MSIPEPKDYISKKVKAMPYDANMKTLPAFMVPITNPLTGAIIGYLPAAGVPNGDGTASLKVVGDAAGPTGPQGVAGPTGPQGVAGPTGPDYPIGRVTGTDFTTTNLTATPITGLSLSLAANEVKFFEVFLSTNSSSVLGLKYSVQTPAGATIEAQLRASTTATVLSWERLIAVNTLTTDSFNNVNGDGIAHIAGIVTNGATPGTLAIGLAKVTSGTATVRINSVLTGRTVV